MSLRGYKHIGRRMYIMVRQYERRISGEELEFDERPRASDSSPAWKKIVALGESVPESAWDKVPTDLARNWRSYKYGASEVACWMMPVFADASYWIALLNPRDEFHEIAIHLSMELESSRIVTSEMVLAELLNHMAEYGSEMRRLVIDTARYLERDPRVEIVRQTSEQRVLGRDRLLCFSFG